MAVKNKGLNAERELVRLFWSFGWAAVRVAASGATSNPSCDVIAGNGTRRFAIECKATKDTKQYFSKKEISELKEFAMKFGAEAWVAIRFDRLDWFFINLEDLNETEASYVIDIYGAKTKGLKFDELI